VQTLLISSMEEI